MTNSYGYHVLFLAFLPVLQAAVYNNRLYHCTCLCPKENNPLCATIGATEAKNNKPKLQTFAGSCEFQCYARCNEEPIRFIYCGKCDTREFESIRTPVTEDRFKCLEFNVKKPSDLPPLPPPSSGSRPPSQPNPGGENGEGGQTGVNPTNPGQGGSTGDDGGGGGEDGGGGGGNGGGGGDGGGGGGGGDGGSETGPVVPSPDVGNGNGDGSGSDPSFPGDGGSPGGVGGAVGVANPNPPKPVDGAGAELPPCTTTEATGAGRFAKNKIPPVHAQREFVPQSRSSKHKNPPVAPPKKAYASISGRNVYGRPRPPTRTTKKPTTTSTLPPRIIIEDDFDGGLVLGDYDGNNMKRDANSISSYLLKGERYKMKNPKFHKLMYDSKYQYPHGISFA